LLIGTIHQLLLLQTIVFFDENLALLLQFGHVLLDTPKRLFEFCGLCFILEHLRFHGLELVLSLIPEFELLFALCFELFVELGEIFYFSHAAIGQLGNLLGLMQRNRELGVLQGGTRALPSSCPLLAKHTSLELFVQTLNAAISLQNGSIQLSYLLLQALVDSLHLSLLLPECFDFLGVKDTLLFYSLLAQLDGFKLVLHVNAILEELLVLLDDKAGDVYCFRKVTFDLFYVLVYLHQLFHCVVFVLVHPLGHQGHFSELLDAV